MASGNGMATVSCWNQSSWMQGPKLYLRLPALPVGAAEHGQKARCFTAAWKRCGASTARRRSMVHPGASSFEPATLHQLEDSTLPAISSMEVDSSRYDRFVIFGTLVLPKCESARIYHPDYPCYQNCSIYLPPSKQRTN